MLFKASISWSESSLFQFLLQDSDWEEVREGDEETDKDMMYLEGATSNRPTHEHLEAMAKAFNEVFSPLHASILW